MPPEKLAVPSNAPLAVGRLKKRAQFLHVAEGGRKAVASTLVVQARQIREESEAPLAQFGFTVTKKTGNAVVRNRIRRRLREAAAREAARAATPGWDFVVIGRHTALDAPYDTILRDMRYALRKAVRQPHTGERGEKK